MKKEPVITVIELTEDEARAFILFREHEALFRTLLTAGVFGVHNGSAELHFDSHANLASIDLHVKAYRRGNSPAIVVVPVDKVRVGVE